MTDVTPGDWAVINTGTKATPFIRLGEALCNVLDGRPGLSEWDHAVICSRVETGSAVALNPPVLYIVEAQPGGAVEVPWHYEGRPHMWSSGIISMPEAAGQAAVEYAGVGYSFLDYFAIAAHELHIPVPGLRAFIASTRHMVCSQLVDRAAADAGKQLFADGRWAGYVKPSDLGGLLAAAGAQVMVMP